MRTAAPQSASQLQRAATFPARPQPFSPQSLRDTRRARGPQLKPYPSRSYRQPKPAALLSLGQEISSWGEPFFGVAAGSTPRLDLGRDLSTSVIGDAVRPSEPCLACCLRPRFDTSDSAFILGLTGLCLGPAAKAACTCLRAPFAEAARRRLICATDIDLGPVSSTKSRASLRRERVVSTRRWVPLANIWGHHQPVPGVQPLLSRVLVADGMRTSMVNHQVTVRVVLSALGLKGQHHALVFNPVHKFRNPHEPFGFGEVMDLLPRWGPPPVPWIPWVHHTPLHPERSVTINGILLYPLQRACATTLLSVIIASSPGSLAPCEATLDKFPDSLHHNGPH